MRLRFGTILAATLCAGLVAEGAGNAGEKWNIFSDVGLFEGGVRKTDKGFAADENGIRVETEVETGVAGVTRRRTVVRNLSEKPLVATCLLDSFRFEGGDSVTVSDWRGPFAEASAVAVFASSPRFDGEAARETAERDAAEA